MRRTLLFLAVLAAAMAAADAVSLQHGPRELSGTVTYADPAATFFFFKADDGAWWRASLKAGEEQPMLGDHITVRGEVLYQTVNNRIDRCEISSVERHPDYEPAYENVSISQLHEHPVLGSTEPDRFARLLSVSGRVTDVNRRVSSVQLILSDGQRNLTVSFSHPSDRPLPEGLVLGALVRVKGVYVYVTLPTASRHPVFTGITQPTIMLPSEDGLEILTKPPFWTPVRAWSAVGIASFVGFCLVLWGVSLRRTVRRQVKVIEAALRERAVADGARRERLRLSHDLHDDFQQLLAGTMFRISAAQNWLDEHDEEKVREQLDKATVNLVHTQNQLRTVLWGLQEECEGPGRLTDLFRYAAGRMAHWEKVVTIDSAGREPAVARTMAGGLLMILQEAVGNAIRHGQARHVSVLVAFAERGLSLTITDDGCGFDRAKQGHGLGLGSMEERAKALGGTFELTSSPGAGTSVKVEVPL